MTVTIDLIKELRAKTGVGMADCKKALEETSGDIEKAIEYLRKKGASLATKRADKMTNEGAVKNALSNDRTKGVIVEINCETDFVAKGDDFQNFSNDVAKTALENNISDVESLLKVNLNGLSVQETLDGLMGKLGEKIEIKKLESVTANNGFITEYIHFGSKLGGLVAFIGNKTDEALDLGRKIAMQVVAMNPMALSRDAITPEVAEKEKEIYKTLAIQEGKPENIIDKIVSNKLEKFYQENVLLEQSFLQDEKKTVDEILKEFNKKTGNNLSISKMVRFQLG